MKEEFALSNMLRVRFKRGENTKFVSHLDLMKTFDRAFRRAGLPLAYSQGFNPHPSMVFGLPLSVGVTSEAEYMDAELTEEMEKEEFLDRINKSLPAGLECIEAEYFSGKGNIMKEIAFASYDLLAATDEKAETDEIQANIEKLKNTAEIIVKKEGKNGLKDMDIKPMVIEVAFGTKDSADINHIHFRENKKVLNIDGTYVRRYIEGVKNTNWNISYDPEKVLLFSILCSAGSKANMKPELFLQALENAMGKKIKVVKVHRTGLFIEKNGEISSPI